MKHCLFTFNQNNLTKFVFCFFTLLLTSFCVDAQENGPFTTGFEETIPSKILSQQRKIWIHIPKRNGGNKVKDRGHYPVVYVLDGSENFNTVVSITEHMEESSLCPPLIVVGIVPVDRLSELTTVADEESPEVVGNGDKFMSFVEKELIPYIDTNYPTTTYKTLIGHSLGGLTVINTFLHIRIHLTLMFLLKRHCGGIIGSLWKKQRQFYPLRITKGKLYSWRWPIVWKEVWIR